MRAGKIHNPRVVACFQNEAGDWRRASVKLNSGIRMEKRVELIERRGRCAEKAGYFLNYQFNIGAGGGRSIRINIKGL